MMFPLKNCKIGPVFMPVFMPIKQENLRSLLENSLKSLKNSGFLVLEIQALKTVSEKRESWNHYNWGIAAVDSIKQWCFPWKIVRLALFSCQSNKRILEVS